MIPIEILMLTATLLMFAIVIVAMVFLFIQSERNAKRLMAKNLQEYELSRIPKEKRELSVFKTDEELYYEDKLKRDKLEKQLKGKMEALKREEVAFDFQVERNG